MAATRKLTPAQRQAMIDRKMAFAAKMRSTPSVALEIPGVREVIAYRCLAKGGHKSKTGKAVRYKKGKRQVHLTASEVAAIQADSSVLAIRQRVLEGEPGAVESLLSAIGAAMAQVVAGKTSVARGVRHRVRL